MSNSSSTRIFATKFPQFLTPYAPFTKTLISSIPKTPSNLSFFKSISIQRIPTKQSPSPSQSQSQSAPQSLQPIEELPPKLQEIIKQFQSVTDSKSKYEQLMFYGKNLSPPDSQFKTNENKVQGCVSQVWVTAVIDSDKNVSYHADSDSILTEGLAALLVLGLSGRPVEEILRVSPDFVTLLGLQQSLTPSRNNGFLNMLKLMQKKALQAYVEAEKGAEFDWEDVVSANDNEKSVESLHSNLTVNGFSEFDESNECENGESESSTDVLGNRGERIRAKLDKELSPLELEVVDVSYQHAGHAGVRGSDGETHFNLKVVLEKFEGKSSIKRHRMIYDLLQDELQSGLHALSIVAKAPSQVDR